MTTLNLPQISASLEATPQVLRTLLTPLEPETLHWRPGPAEWTVNEVIGHLIDTDDWAFAGRMQSMIAQYRPTLESRDLAEITATRRDDEKDVQDLIDELAALRPACAAFILNLTPDQLKREGVHRSGTVFLIEDFVEEWLYHDQMHLRQILGNIQHCLWIRMGRLKPFVDRP